MYIGVLLTFKKNLTMSIKLHVTKYLAVSALTMLLLGACSKNNIYIDVVDPDGEENSGNPSGNDGGNDNGNPSKESALVTFSASVEGRNITRSMSPMGKGLQSWLCAYLSNTSNTITGAPIAEGSYITSSPGVLTGNNGYKMYLSNNIYSFYAVSCNSKNPAPTFTNGISEALSNGVDYLWWHAVHQDIASSQINVPITYQHAATQVVVAIAGGENITLNKIISATITPPKPGAIMDLSTGIISSEVILANPVNMGINDFTVQYIMLPVKSTSPLTLKLELMVNGESFSRTYTTPLAPPDNLLSAGNSYLFRAVINENSVSFANVSVKEWTEVDESGNPLYPVQD